MSPPGGGRRPTLFTHRSLVALLSMLYPNRVEAPEVCGPSRLRRTDGARRWERRKLAQSSKLQALERQTAADRIRIKSLERMLAAKGVFPEDLLLQNQPPKDTPPAGFFTAQRVGPQRQQLLGQRIRSASGYASCRS